MPGESRCCKCEKVLPKIKIYCRCRRFKFCNHECYSERPMREWHKEECDKKADARIKLLKETKAAAVLYKKRKLAQEQPRKTNGQFKDQQPKSKETSTEISEEERARRNLNSKTSKAISGLKKYGRKLHKTRKRWGIRIAVHRNGVGCKTDPIVYETKNFSASKQYLENRKGPCGDMSPGSETEEDDADASDENENDLTFEEGELQILEEKAREPRRPKYRCYVCNKTTGTRIGYVCGGENSGQRCLMGAACENCINLDLNCFNQAERKKIKANWRCPLHKKSTVAPSGEESTPGDQETEVDQTQAPLKAKKPRNFKLLKASEELKKLLRPTDLNTKELFTKQELVKGVHQYIKEHPQLKKSDPLTKTVLVHPDDLLRDVYGDKPFQAISMVPKMKDHITDSNQKTTASAIPTSNQPSTSDETATDSSTRREELRAAITFTEGSSSRKANREPKKFLSKDHLRKPVFHAPPRVPPAPKNSDLVSGRIPRKTVEDPISGECSSPSLGNLSVGSEISAAGPSSDISAAGPSSDISAAGPSSDIGAAGPSSDISAARETPMQICHQCGYLQYLKTLESNGCEYCLNNYY